jgi:hypothetical protein
MEPRFAWVLNLDADLELGEGARYSPGKSVRAAMRPHVERLRASLLAPDDVLIDGLDEQAPSAAARGLPGRAFCPTPRAIATLLRAGAEPEPHAPVQVLRRVNSRAFAAALGSTLPGAAFVLDRSTAEAHVAQRPPVGDAWRVKRAFGMAGRGQRVFGAGAPLSPKDRGFLHAALAKGGAQIEPNVAIVDEYALHGVIAPDAAFTLGTVVRQRCDAHGAWVATERIEDVTALGALPERLVEEACRVARALAGAGYFGPFGIDAFTYRDHDGATRLQPCSEINARYSMGFAVGYSSSPLAFTSTPR